MGWLYNEEIDTDKRTIIELGKLAIKVRIDILRKAGFTNRKIGEILEMPEDHINKYD